MSLTNFAYIQLPKQVVQWNLLNEFIEKVDKIEIIKSHNNHRKKNYIVRVIPYVKIQEKLFTDLISSVADNDNIPNNFKNGIKSLLSNNFLPYKVILQLVKYDDALIPEEWLKLISKFTSTSL